MSLLCCTASAVGSDLPFLFYRRVVSASQSVHNRGLLTSEELEYPIGINSRLHPDQSTL